MNRNPWLATPKGVIVLFSMLLLSMTLSAHATKIINQRSSIQNPCEDGWHLAHSWRGYFSVRVPEPYNSYSVEDIGTIHVVRSQTEEGLSFEVSFIPLGEYADVEKKFELDLSDQSMTVSRVEEYPAIIHNQQLDHEDLGPLSIYLKRIRTGDGIYAMVVTAPKRLRGLAIRDKDKFFNSITVTSGDDQSVLSRTQCHQLDDEQ